MTDHTLRGVAFAAVYVDERRAQAFPRLFGVGGRDLVIKMTEAR